MSMRGLFVVALVVNFSAVACSADDWQQWLGPARDGRVEVTADLVKEGRSLSTATATVTEQHRLQQCRPTAVHMGTSEEQAAL